MLKLKDKPKFDHKKATAGIYARVKGIKEGVSKIF